MNAIKINNLTKSYNKHLVLENIDLEISNDKYNFILGGNGVGKSTFIKCLLDEVKYQGSINLNNKKISYAPERLNLPEYIKMYDFLLLISKINGLKENTKIDQYLETFEILKYKNYQIGKLSNGTKRKIVIIQALINNSDIYIFDEPLTGLDENLKNSFIKELRKFKKNNKIIIIATHRLNDFKVRDKNIIQFGVPNEFNEITSKVYIK